ncbi:MAG: MFS transporter [Rhodocyclaceae bacterium]|nr:MFS transporter [Rhodocyclaceae bacterium]
MASRFAEGAGVIAVAVSAPALLSATCAPLDRRFALGIWSGYLPAGVGLVMLLAPLVVPAGGWRGLWLLTLAAILLAAVAVYRLRPAYRLPPPSSVERHPFVTAKEALSQPEPWLLAIAM